MSRRWVYTFTKNIQGIIHYRYGKAKDSTDDLERHHHNPVTTWLREVAVVVNRFRLVYKYNHNDWILNW